MRDYDGKTAAARVTERRDKLIEAGFELFGRTRLCGHVDPGRPAAVGID